MSDLRDVWIGFLLFLAMNGLILLATGAGALAGGTLNYRDAYVVCREVGRPADLCLLGPTRREPATPTTADPKPESPPVGREP